MIEKERTNNNNNNNKRTLVFDQSKKDEQPLLIPIISLKYNLQGSVGYHYSK